MPYALGNNTLKKTAIIITVFSMYYLHEILRFDKLSLTLKSHNEFYALFLLISS